MASSDTDAATEALIAQLMAEDLGEMYYRHSLPIGSSYHDYEEPLSSYERQCLDAENNPEEEGEGASGWGPHDPDEANGAASHDESLDSTEPADDGTWNSRYMDEDGVLQTAAPSLQSETSPSTSENSHESSHNGDNCDVDSTDQESFACPGHTISPPSSSASHDLPKKTTEISGQTTSSTEARSCLWSEPVRDHLDDAPSPPTSPIPISDPPAYDTREELPAIQPLTKAREVEDRWDDGPNHSSAGNWDDGLDYSSAKGKGKAVRAYDEFKLGLRDVKDGWTRIDDEHETSAHVENADHDTEEEGETGDEHIPFIRVPWPSIEQDELLARREDTEVVEIHVGDDETLESILRDIDLRDERRRKGKAVEGWGEMGMEDVAGRKDVVASW